MDMKERGKGCVSFYQQKKQTNILTLVLLGGSWYISFFFLEPVCINIPSFSISSMFCHPRARPRAAKHLPIGQKKLYKIPFNRWQCSGVEWVRLVKVLAANGLSGSLNRLSSTPMGSLAGWRGGDLKLRGNIHLQWLSWEVFVCCFCWTEQGQVMLCFTIWP